MSRKLKPKPTPTPCYQDAQQQYKAFAFLVHICNWTRTEAYTACFPNTVSTGQSLNNVASRFWNRQDIQAIVDDIDLYEVQKFIDAKVALMEKNANSFAFAKKKPEQPCNILPDSENIPDQLTMTDEELMDNAIKLLRGATSRDERKDALKLITDIKKKLNVGDEDDLDDCVSRYYVPTSCSGCNLYQQQANALQQSVDQ